MNIVFLKILFIFSIQKVFPALALFSFSLLVYPGQQSETTSDSIATLLEEDRLNLFQRDSALYFYSKRKNRPAWQNTVLRKTFTEFLKSAELQGLYYREYHGEEIDRLGHMNDLSEGNKNKLDILLTDAFFKLGKHLLKGKVDPREIHGIWDVEENRLPLTEMLQQSIEDNEINSTLNKIKPPLPIYDALITASEEYTRLKKKHKNLEAIEQNGLIKKGEEDGRLPAIQQRLQLLGFLEKKDSLDIIYTEEIEKAIRKFQKEHRLQLDGIIGPGTLAALNENFEKKHRQILVNLERWRWYPRHLGEQYLLINIADFSMNLIKNGDTLRTHKVVVGRKDRKTPVFSDKVAYLVFNPDWTIPPTIKKEDVIPAIRKNPDYLKNNNMEVFDSGGQKLDPYTVDWGSNRVYSFTYRQKPGPSNPMGRVKIMYPNDYLIFSHDNPAQHLFENNVRANSSGCVRVEGAIDLAKYLLEEKFTSEEIDRIVASNNTKTITIEKDVKVHHLYWTAWRENGKTRLIKDLYGYDEKIWDALKTL